MKRDYLILLVFLSIMAISGAIIFVVQTSQTKLPPQAQGLAIPDEQPPQTTAGPDTSKVRGQIESLKKQLKNDPDNFELLASLGNAHYDIGDPANAIEYYERALKLRPNNPGVIVDLGAMYRQNGNPDKAIEMFKKAIELDPQLPQAYFNLGMILRMEKNDPVGAAQAWKRYLELDPNSQAREFLESEIANTEAQQKHGLPD